MIPCGILLADGDWIGIVVFVIFVVFSILSQAAAKWKEVQREAARRRRVNPPEPLPKAANRAEPLPKPASPLEDEIAEFLRRAANRQKAGQDRPVAPSAPPLSPADASARRVEPPPLAVEPVPVAKPPRESVAEHVKKRLKRPRVSKVGTAELGREVAQADDRLDERIRKKFDHAVGQLARSGASGQMAGQAPQIVDLAAAPRSPNAATLAAMLANPVTLRQVVLAGEILRRPEERWSR